MPKILFFFLVVLFSSSGPFPAAAEETASHRQTADPAASEATRAILRYWAALPQRSENRVISGQFLGHAERKSNLGSAQEAYDRLVAGLHEETGLWVALIGADYGLLMEQNEPVDLSATNAPLISHWQKGGLVTVSWHARNPWTGANSRDNTITGHFSDLLKPGTPVNAVWMKELDQVADALAELQQAGVTVLWRPFHEWNGRSFWWAQPRTARQQREIWRHMFGYFTGQKGLHNLLWVYSPLPQNSKVVRAEGEGYPGSAYVDMVGLDIYDPEIKIEAAYKRLLKAAPGKPVWLTEFGPFKGSQARKNPELLDPHFDYMRLIEAIQHKYPQMTGFQAWNRSWSLAGQKNAKQLLEHPWVANLDDLELKK